MNSDKLELGFTKQHLRHLFSFFFFKLLRFLTSQLYGMSPKANHMANRH